MPNALANAIAFSLLNYAVAWILAGIVWIATPREGDA